MTTTRGPCTGGWMVRVILLSLTCAAIGLGTTAATSAGATTTPTSTHTATVTPTTLAPLQGQIPTPPSTLPLVTRSQSAHVDPVLAKVSLGGLGFALLIMLVQFVLTRPGRAGRRTL